MKTHDDIAGLAAPLDVLLIESALGPVQRFAPDSSTVRWLGELAKQPTATARRLGAFASEGAKIVAGNSDVAPSKRDRRFGDPAWSSNPLLRRLLQGYLAAGRTANDLVASTKLNWRDEQRVRFLVENTVEALSPSNLPLVNPASAKAAIDSAGANLLRGSAQFVKDMSAAPRIPEMVDKSKFAVGENIATTEGAVVFRNAVFELIQYKPQHDEVYRVPILVVPPTINKFYAIDLAPGRSLIEHAVRQGRQLFCISWRNPDARHADWNFDTYVKAIVDALDAVRSITGSETSALAGICSGGILASITAAYLAGIGQLDRISAMVLAVTVIDNEKSGTVSAINNRRLARAAKAMSRRKGYLDGKALAEVFAWLRPGDLIWNYWVNNYLLGKKPPAFDILFWNSDTTRMTAGLHADFVDLAIDNTLVKPGALTVLGVPIDLGKIDVDAYIVAGISDHITPWQNCYQTTQLFGGKSRFVLSTSGHIAALVNPPGNPKSSFYVGEGTPANAQEWLAKAESTAGSWWGDLSAWLDERAGDRKPAPPALGTPALPALAAAPGTYVFDN
ncbi:MAG: alpha/beta fold hydrolase [Nocardiaceae bacterium]|nr:alpha/beta fold hydrolase [Nocardiaceae bacterium]